VTLLKQNSVLKASNYAIYGIKTRLNVVFLMHTNE